MNAAEARALPDTNDAIFPFWSPDGRSLGFFSNGKMKVIELDGTTAQPLCDAQLGRGATWGPNGIIVYSPSPIAPLFEISAAGGTPTQLTKLDPAMYSSHRWPAFLPDGKLSFTSRWRMIHRSCRITGFITRPLMGAKTAH
jgi:eukaryotic-like serine/threonine-protein kinase